MTVCTGEDLEPPSTRKVPLVKGINPIFSKSGLVEVHMCKERGANRKGTVNSGD